MMPNDDPRPPAGDPRTGQVVPMADYVSDAEKLDRVYRFIVRLEAKLDALDGDNVPVGLRVMLRAFGG